MGCAAISAIKDAMTREEVIAALSAIERALEQRVEVWREVIEMDGTVSRRIYRGFFTAPRASG